MNNNSNTTEQISVQYVNQRNGNKPASIKSSDGRFFTVSDGGLAMFQQGAQGMITYYTKPNNKGGFYLIATHWNGMQLPDDRKANGYPQMNIPQNPNNSATQINAPQGNASPTKSMDVQKSIILQTIIKSCSGNTGTTQEADMWLKWYSERMRTGVPQNNQAQQPVTNQHPQHAYAENNSFGQSNPNDFGEQKPDEANFDTGDHIPF